MNDVEYQTDRDVSRPFGSWLVQRHAGFQRIMHLVAARLRAGFEADGRVSMVRALMSEKKPPGYRTEHDRHVGRTAWGAVVGSVFVADDEHLIATSIARRWPRDGSQRYPGWRAMARRRSTSRQSRPDVARCSTSGCPNSAGSTLRRSCTMNSVPR